MRVAFLSLRCICGFLEPATGISKYGLIYAGAQKNAGPAGSRSSSSAMILLSACQQAVVASGLSSDCRKNRSPIHALFLDLYAGLVSVAA